MKVGRPAAFSVAAQVRAGHPPAHEHARRDRHPRFPPLRPDAGGNRIRETPIPMKTFDLAVFRDAVAAGRIEWRKHVLQKLAERGISQQSVREVLLSGERIRDYTDDKPFPSALFLGYCSGKPLHAVAACDETSQRAFIITAYEPSLEIFEADYRTRRK